jgi:hypothetical protein
LFRTTSLIVISRLNTPVPGEFHVLSYVALISPLGAQIQVPFEVESTEAVPTRLLEVLRDFGGRGFHAPVPIGGYRFPLANADDFDWRLIGARPGSKKFPKERGGTETKLGLWHAGHFYVRREGEEVQRASAQMPEAVWYSRFSSGNEPPGTVIEESGRAAYVRLITFRGDGRKVHRYADPSRTGGSTRAA